MRINGEWLLFDDGVVRPVIRGEILDGHDLLTAAEFLVDSGADRTVFSAPVLRALHLQPITTQEDVGGLGEWFSRSSSKPKSASVVRRKGTRSFFTASMLLSRR
jgi:hypothetical protein